MLYSFFWVISRRLNFMYGLSVPSAFYVPTFRNTPFHLNFMCRRFGTLFHLNFMFRRFKTLCPFMLCSDVSELRSIWILCADVSEHSVPSYYAPTFRNSIPSGFYFPTFRNTQFHLNFMCRCFEIHFPTWILCVTVSEQFVLSEFCADVSERCVPS